MTPIRIFLSFLLYSGLSIAYADVTTVVESFDLTVFIKENYLFFVIVLLVFFLHSYYALRTRFLNAELQSEIEQKNKLLAQIRQMATRDELTGLPNRKLSFQLLRKELMHSRRTGTRLALLFIDLNNFKDINERFGNERGDQFLHEIGQVFKHLMRGNDLAGRLGGDEFLVLLSDVRKPEDATVVAEKLIHQIGTLSVSEVEHHEISINIGVIFFVADESSSIESLLAAANTLLHQARQTGPGEFRMQNLTSATLTD